MNYGKQATLRRQKTFDAKGTKLRKKFGVFLGKAILVCLLLLSVVGISSGIGIWKGIVDSAPDISAMDVTPTGFSTTVYSQSGEQIATLVASGANRKYVTIDEVPLDLQHAFVAIEDSRFYEHNGIDPKAIIRAGIAGIMNGFHFNQGGSTITQQLLKNSVLEEAWANESSKLERIQRKLQEQYLAVALEKQVNNKDWILENYMNTINLGSNTLGVQAAANRYFGKDVSELTLSECAVIAGIAKNPYGYNPISHPGKNAERRTLVLDAMLKENYISQKEYDEALADDVYSRISEHNTYVKSTASSNSYFVDAMTDQLFDDLVALGHTEAEAYKLIYQGGLSICTTQDLDIQAVCDEEVNNLENYPTDPKYSFSLYFQVQKADGTTKSYTHQTMLSYYQKQKGSSYNINFSTEEACYEAIAAYEEAVLEEGDTFLPDTESITITLQPQVALTVIDQRTGEVKALVGGRGEKEGNRILNRGTDTPRQPGSTFKIIGCYAAALDAGGVTLATTQDDAPYTVGTKTYRNYNDKYGGYTSVRAAIIDSINIVTVKTLEQIGVNLGYQYAENFGFSTLVDDDKNLGLCLGGLTYGVTNLELTAAYAAIANEGVYKEPIFYTVVYDHDGNVLIDKTASQESHRVIKDTTAWLLTSAMQDVMTKGSGTSAYFGANMAQAGKSGTTTSNRDAVWAGYTPYYTCTIWGGYDDNAEQKQNQTSYPKRIWKAVMSRIHENLPYEDFTKPEGITSLTVCKVSGLLPIEGICDTDPRGSMLVTEYFDSENFLEYEETQQFVLDPSLNTSTDTFSAGVAGDIAAPSIMPYCDVHTSLNICAASGMIAGPFCPQELITPKVFITGGTEGSTEYELNATPEFMLMTCPVHNLTNYIPDNVQNPEAPAE